MYFRLCNKKKKKVPPRFTILQVSAEYTDLVKFITVHVA